MSAGDDATVVLSNGDIEVHVRPHRGGDISAIYRTEESTNLLLELTPTLAPTESDDSWTQWHGAYDGGWQSLFPNAGDATEVEEQWWPFHGESPRRRWRVEDVSTESVALVCDLDSVALTARRQISLSGCRVDQRERLTAADAAGPVDFMWVQHLAIGSLFMRPGMRLFLDATECLIEELREGSDTRAELPAGWQPWDSEAGRLDFIPPSSAPRRYLAYARGLNQGRAVVADRQVGLALTWDCAMFPFVWLWQENCYSPGFPWEGRTRAWGIEPATSWPAHGINEARRRGSPLLRLAPNESIDHLFTVEVLGEEAARLVAGADHQTSGVSRG